MIDRTRKDFMVGLAVAVVAIIVYANSLGNGFVWDDEVIIVTNPALRGDALSLFNSIDNAREYELTPYYRPLTYFTFLMENRLHGLTPFYMHLFNVLLHAANAFLVYRLVLVLIGDRAGAGLAGICFAVHPLHAEAVNFISGGRNTMLACFFILAAYLTHRQSMIRDNIFGAIAAAVFFMAGLFSKEIALAALPFIGSLEIAPVFGTDRAGRQRAFVRLVPYVVFTAFYLLLRHNALTGSGVRLEILPGLGERLADNLYIIPRYLLTLVWPVSLSPKYFVPKDLYPLALPLAAAWLFMVGIIGWLIFRGRSHATLFGLFWLTAFWMPVSGIFRIPSAPLADRYFYVPAIGLWLVAADQIVGLLPSRYDMRRYGTAAAISVILLLAVLTVRRNLDWKSDITLFTRMVEQYPEHAYSHHNLGCAYLDKAKNLDLAEREFQKTLTLDPSFPRLQDQLAWVRRLKGDDLGALSYYDKALLQNPFDAEARLNHGIVLEHLGRKEEAIAEFKFFLAMPGKEWADQRPYAEERLKALSR